MVALHAPQENDLLRTALDEARRGSTETSSAATATMLEQQHRIQELEVRTSVLQEDLLVKVTEVHMRTYGGCEWCGRACVCDVPAPWQMQQLRALAPENAKVKMQMDEQTAKSTVLERPLQLL